MGRYGFLLLRGDGIGMLCDMSRGLSGIPEKDRQEILEEVAGHLHSAEQKGEPVEKTLAGLGSAEKLAHAYAFGYGTAARGLRLADLPGSLAFYATIGLSGMILVPTLVILAVTFVAVAIFIPCVAVGNYIGFVTIPMFTFGSASISPGPLQLLLSIFVGVLFLWLAALCRDGLRRYLSAVSARYRARRLGR